MRSYILEVQQFDSNGHNIHPEWNGKCNHIGYMNKMFRTKREASDYYDRTQSTYAVIKCL